VYNALPHGVRIAESIPETIENGSVDIEKMGTLYWISLHRETIVADYKRIAAMLTGSVGRADSRMVGGGGRLMVE